MNAAADFHPPVVKNEVSTLFQGILLYEDQHPWLSLPFHFILTRAENPYKGGLLACEQNQKSLFDWDFGVQECW